MSILGVGTEIVECLRIAKMIERYGEQFINRVYSNREIEYCRARAAATQQFAAHWAAKEAVRKSLGARWRTGYGWRDIEIRTVGGAAPVVAFRGHARDVVESLGVEHVFVSLAFCRNYATAYAVATLSSDFDPDDED